MTWQARRGRLGEAGEARRGAVRLGGAWQARRGRRGLARLGLVRTGKARQAGRGLKGSAWQDAMWQVPVRQGMAWRGLDRQARHGPDRRGMPRQDLARLGMAIFIRMKQNERTG